MRYIGPAICLVIVMVLFTTFPVSQAAQEPASGWGIPELIESNDEQNTHFPKVALDGQGNAIAVWTSTYFSGEDIIYANRYVKESGWTGPEALETSDMDASDAQIAMDKDGNGMAVWRQSDGAKFHIYSNRYTMDKGWDRPELVEQDLTHDAFLPYVATNPQGNVMAMWAQKDGSNYNVYVNSYEPKDGWGNAKPVNGVPGGMVANTRLAIGPSGEAIAVWSQNDSVRFSIWCNRYTPTWGWENDFLLETDDAGDAGAVNVEFDPAGNAMVLWTQSDGVRNNNWFNLYSTKYGWTGTKLLEDDDKGDAYGPDVGFDQNGNATAVWYQSDGTMLNIITRTLTAGGGWSDPVLLEDYDDGYAMRPVICVDPLGNAVVAWQQFDGVHINICSNILTNGIGWGKAQLIETSNAGDVDRPSMAMDPSGNAIVVWEYDDGQNTNTMANRFVRPDKTPPYLVDVRPLDGTLTNSTIIHVTGMTEPGVQLDINGLAITVAKNGAFDCYVTLPWFGRIDITATDASGNSFTKSIHLHYWDTKQAELDHRIDELLSDILDLENDLNSTLSEVALLRGLIEDLDIPENTSVANLTGVMENLSRIERTLNEQGADIGYLDRLVGALNGSGGEVNLSSLRQSLNALMSDMNDTQEELEDLASRIEGIPPTNDLEEELDETKDDLSRVKGTNVILAILLGINAFLTIVMIIAFMVTRRNTRQGNIGPEE